jgi:hypothetical protein
MMGILLLLFAFFTAKTMSFYSKNGSIKPATVRMHVYTANKSDVGGRIN